MKCDTRAFYSYLLLRYFVYMCVYRVRAFIYSQSVLLVYRVVLFLHLFHVPFVHSVYIRIYTHAFPVCVAYSRLFGFCFFVFVCIVPRIETAIVFVHLFRFHFNCSRESETACNSEKKMNCSKHCSSFVDDDVDCVGDDDDDAEKFRNA